MTGKTIEYKTRSDGELIQKNERWNINDFINFKFHNGIEYYYSLVRKYDRLKIASITKL